MPDPHDADHDKHRPRRRRGLMVAAAALVALGGAAGAVVVAQTRPAVTMAPATPVAITALASGGIATIRGHVAEIYGNKFVLADTSGRALVDTGREGDNRHLVTPGEAVTVQGRFDRGFLHAAFLVGPDNTVTALGPLEGPPYFGGHHHRRDDGPGGPDGPDGPPPPPGAGRADGAPGAPPPPPPVGTGSPVQGAPTVPGK